jgi:pimeloyl-ACP methyl ester carboxylesterase
MHHPSSAPTVPTDESDKSSAIHTLPDGRKLGYAQVGSPTGKPVFYLHGTPGSCVEAIAFDEMGKKSGARVIATDRPGYGLSSPHPGRTILDHAKDVEHLAEFLKMKSYGVLVCTDDTPYPGTVVLVLANLHCGQGISGGGPYALACAASIPPNKLKTVSVVCGLGPPDLSKKGMDWWHWLGFTIGFRCFPRLTGFWFGRDPAAQLHLTDERRLELIQQNFEKSKPHPKDAEVYRDGNEFRIFNYASRQMFRQGMDGFVQDGRLISMDFGFRIEDVRVPVHLWYGKLDTSVPIVQGEEIARRLGRYGNLRVKDETHASITMNWREQILGELVKSL